MNEVLKAIRERRSIRKYRPEKLSDADLDAILDAGTWAASAKGIQPALIVSINDEADVDALRRANAEIWGRPAVDPFYGAPNIVVVLADGANANWLQDGALVMGNLMLAAHAVGAGSCWINRAIEYFDRADGKAMLEKWGIPQTYRGVAICALGYSDGPAAAPKARKSDYIRRV